MKNRGTADAGRAGQGEAEGEPAEPGDAAEAENAEQAPAGYFSSRLRPTERTIGLVMVVVAAGIGVGGWTADYVDTRDTRSLALAAAGLGLSILFWLAVRNGRRVVAAFAAILPPLIPPAYKGMAFAQFVFFAYAAWLMVKASNEASRSAAARRQRSPRSTPAERAAARRAARQPASASGRTTPKPSKRYTPPAPKKKRPPAPAAASPRSGSAASAASAPSTEEPRASRWRGRGRSADGDGDAVDD